MQNPFTVMARLHLNTKLLLGFAFVLIIALLIGVRSQVALSEMNVTALRIFEHDLLGVSHVKEANIDLVYIGRNLRQMILAGNPVDRQAARTRLDAARLSLQKNLDEARARTEGEENRQLLAEFDVHYAQYLRNVDQLVSRIETDPGPLNDWAIQALRRPDFAAAGDRADEKLTALSRAKEQSAERAVQDATAKYERIRSLSIFLLLCGLLGGGVFAWLIGISIRRPIDDLRTSIESIASGRLDITVPHVDYRNELGPIARSIAVLQQGARDLEIQRWVKQGLMEIDQAVQATLTFEEFGNALAARLAPLLELVYCALYVNDAEGTGLRRVGGYGCDDSIHVSAIAPGQGMVGQAARDRRQISLSLPADETTRITTGLGRLQVRAMLISPIVDRDSVLAVLEIGALESLAARKTVFVDAMLPVLAAKMQILATNIATRSLLEQTKAQALELEAGRQQLTQSEERTRLILGAVGDGIVGMDTEGQMTFSNPAVTDLLGYAKEELIGKSLHALVHYAYPDGRAFPQAECSMFQTAQDGQPRKVDNEVLWREGGTAVPVEYTTTPVRKDGRIIGSVIVFRDITERRQAEKEIREAKEIAEEATRAKSEFLANMSHEIRTPMNVIIGMSHLALQSDLGAKQRNYIEKVNSAAKNLLGIINDILDFSKIEAGKMRFERTDFQLEDVMAQLADLSVIKAQEKGLEILFDVGTDVPTALIGDPLRLGQVIVNLVNNAIKFTEKGEITVGVHTIASEPGSVRLRFDVRDTGIGLTEEQRGKLFSAFSQADASTTRKYGGTGLGLTICKRLVEMMDGEIGADSVAGKGSTFHFTAKFGVQSEQRHLALGAQDVQGLRVLVVDDNASAREILQGILISLKFNAIAVADGAQAIAELERAQLDHRPYGLVLMDWKMSGMDGVETIKRIRADKNLAQTPAFVMVTAYSRDELLEAADGVHLDGLLVKPVSPSTLLDSILKALGKEVTQHTRKHEKQSTYEEAARQVKGAYLLLVEDNELNQEVALEILQADGIRVDVANNGAEAVEKIGQAHYDGVLMDCQMPVMDGFDATRRIRQDPRFAGLPILAMTANAMAGDRERVIAAGMNDHIAKPIDVAQLFLTLARWIKPRQVAAIPDKSQQEPAAGDVPDIPGLDLKNALARVGGSAKLLRKLIRRFAETQAQVMVRIRAAMENCDMHTAIREAHTVKGLAGNIGATLMAEHAGRIEGMLNRGETGGLADSLHAMEAELGSLVRKISAALGASPEAVPASPDAASVTVDVAKVRSILKRLATQLADADADAAESAQQLQALTQGTHLAGGIKNLIAAIADYDFDAAIVQVKAIESKNA